MKEPVVITSHGQYSSSVEYMLPNINSRHAVITSRDYARRGNTVIMLLAQQANPCYDHEL